MREVTAAPRPTHVRKNDFAEAGGAGAELSAGHPECVADRSTRALPANSLISPDEELLLNRQEPGRRAATEGERTVENSESVRHRRLKQAAGVIESPCGSFELQIGQRAEAVRVNTVGGVMLGANARNRAVHCVDVEHLIVGAVRMEEREGGVRGRVEVLFCEQPPVGDDAFLFVTGKLAAPRPIIETLVLSEEERGQRAAEAEGMPPVVGADEPPIHSKSDLASSVRSTQRELAVRRPVGDADPEERVGGISFAEYFVDCNGAGQPFDAVEACVDEPV